MLELGVSPQPEEATFSLPERYAIPLFELLVVDADYVFVSWEISADQLASAAARLGDRGFRNRRLMIVFHEAVEDMPRVLRRELYGETGRWFIRLSRPGGRVLARLGYASGNVFHVLHEAGPVDIPRADLREPAAFDELEVSYGCGQHGRLIMLGTSRTHNAPWPVPALPGPSPAEYYTPRIRAVNAAEEESPVRDLAPSSDRGQVRPSSSSALDLGPVLAGERKEV
jgi:hypothetical protein